MKAKVLTFVALFVSVPLFAAEPDLLTDLQSSQVSTRISALQRLALRYRQPGAPALRSRFPHEQVRPEVENVPPELVSEICSVATNDIVAAARIAAVRTLWAIECRTNIWKALEVVLVNGDPDIAEFVTSNVAKRISGGSREQNANLEWRALIFTSSAKVCSVLVNERDTERLLRHIGYAKQFRRYAPVCSTELDALGSNHASARIRAEAKEALRAHVK